MKNFLHLGAAERLLFVFIGAAAICFRCAAQDNVWTSAASGNWQDGSWSLGILPGTNHTVWITNYGWKAVQIGSATAQSFPESLNVNSITVSSPTNSFNTLLLNHAGSGTPLTVKSLIIASNSALSMQSSALQINGTNGSGAMIGGQFDQNDSVVAGNQVNVGYIGAGVYNFNGGYFTVSQLWLGGDANPGVFIQNGGTNGFGITHLDDGTYVLSNGYFGATIYFDGGEFQQEGGVLDGNLTLFNGSYLLDNGVHQGDTTIPSAEGFNSGLAGMLQAGGTNNGSLAIGCYGSGYYTLSNGVSNAGGLNVCYRGNYQQFGGSQNVTGSIYISEEQIAAYEWQGGFFNLYGGTVSSSGIVLTGYYLQSGGTNKVAGDVTLQGVQTRLSMSGGVFSANNITAYPGFSGGILLTGGTLVVSNQLLVNGDATLPSWRGFSGGGELVVSNICLGRDAIFSCGDCVIDQSGTLTMSDAKLYSGSNSVQFGPLCLASGGGTNSTLYMVSPTSIMGFADSSSVAWADEPMLIVEGWSGSLFGGGRQQLIFGKNASALTSAQLAHIQFHNPAGLTVGTYPARILANGEIVPASSAALPVNMSLSPQPGGMRLTLQGEAGRTYSIETSTDLVHWAPWTSQVNSNGTMTIIDTDSTNYPMRFYRAKLMP